MRFGLLLGILALGCGSLAARADSTVTGSGGGFDGSGTLTATANGDGSYTVTAITSDVGVASLIAPGGFNDNDNQLYPNRTGSLDGKGLAFWTHWATPPTRWTSSTRRKRISIRRRSSITMVFRS